MSYLFQAAYEQAREEYAGNYIYSCLDSEVAGYNEGQHQNPPGHNIPHTQGNINNFLATAAAKTKNTVSPQYMDVKKKKLITM